jgi:hypothetical protein
MAREQTQVETPQPDTVQLDQAADQSALSLLQYDPQDRFRVMCGHCTTSTASGWVLCSFFFVAGVFLSSLGAHGFAAGSPLKSSADRR